MAEQDLILASQKGDLRSFDRLVEDYQGSVYNVAFRMLGNPQSAEDATQNAFLHAYQSIRQFRGGSFRAWLFKIVSNACRDQLRSAQRRPAFSLDALLSKPDDPVDFPGHEELPEDYALRRELSRTIVEGMASLPEEQRWAVVLSDVEGFSYEEIAEATSSSLGTVKSRLNRGRAHLRDYLLQRKELLPDNLRLYK